MAEAIDTGELPVALALPVSVTARNADLKLDITGRATHLDEKGLVVTFQQEVPEGTVLFTTVDMRSINSTVRGLIKVKSQTPIGEHGGYRTIADFVDLNDDSKRKIAKMLGGPAEDLAPVASRSFAVDQIGTQQGGYVRTPQAAANAASVYRPPVAAQASRRAYFEPAPMRAQAKASASTKFWGSLGVTFYVAAFLVVVAFFPSGRAFELMVLGKIGYALERMWYWANHIGQVKLYDNS